MKILISSFNFEPNDSARWWRFALCGVVVSLPFFAAPLTSAQQPDQKSIFRQAHTPNDNPNSDLFAAAASGPADIWGVGESVIHYDGTKWTAVPAPKINGGGVNSLYGVAAASSTDAWAIGDINQTEANPFQIIEHWDGTKWSIAKGPKLAHNTQPFLQTMTLISADDIWASGEDLTHDTQELDFLLEHWNGTAWTALLLPQFGNAFPLGMTNTASNDVWATGFNGTLNDDSTTFALHYDGSSWQQIFTPSQGEGSNVLWSVAALASDDIWAVGFWTQLAPPQYSPRQTLVEHWNGTQWSIVSSPNINPGSSPNALFGVTAVATNDVWACGTWDDGSGNQHTLVEHWDGKTWSIVSAPDPMSKGDRNNVLFAGVAPSPDDLWLFGGRFGGTPGHILDSLVLHTKKD